MNAISYAAGRATLPADATPDLPHSGIALLRALRRACAARAAERRLAALDDRLLADIGLERSEIADAVRGRGRFARTGGRH